MSEGYTLNFPSRSVPWPPLASIMGIVVDGLGPGPLLGIEDSRGLVIAMNKLRRRGGLVSGRCCAL